MRISKPIPRGKMRVERVYQEYGVRETNESRLVVMFFVSMVVNT